jgi:sugar lactone lactonase YvrE
MILGAENKSGSKRATVGEGPYTYECYHCWGEVPSHIVWGETHGVCVDEVGLVYIKHRSNAPEPMDAIAVFEPNGKFVRSFGKEYHGGGHGIDIRKEGGEEFLYLSDVKNGVVAKSTLKGKQIWVKQRPVEPGVYADPKVKYSPTNVCFSPDGGFYIADGYGSHYIHQYDKDATWVRTWGGEGEEAGKMKTPHGLWLDNRPGREPSIVVADRANARLQYFTLDGKHISFINKPHLAFPAAIDTQGDVMLVPDLHARVTLFDKNNEVIVHLGYDPAWTETVLGGMKFELRKHPEQWVDGKFIHPHDACFDKDGNIYVTEWVPTGRVSFLKKVG